MRNRGTSKIAAIFEKASKLPYFTLDDLAGIEGDRHYLTMLLSRYVTSGRAVRLKRAMYVADEYVRAIELSGAIATYPEFLSGVLCEPSYISLEYILYKHNLLTELPVKVTAVTTKKTTSCSNKFGTFIYHSIREDLFTGYDIAKEHDFTIRRARKTKALFDFLYYRKDILTDRKSVTELRLNIDECNNADKRELATYIHKEGSKKMKTIYGYLFS